MIFRLASAALLVLLAMTAQAGTVVAVLPVSDVGGSTEIGALVRDVLEKRLEKIGYTVLASPDVDRLLEAKRVRYLDSLSEASRNALREELHADVIVLASLLAYRENGNPLVGVAARMIDVSGAVIWADLVASSANESEGPLGSGRFADAASLARHTAQSLAGRVPAADRRERALRLNSGVLTRGPVTYRSSSHGKGELLRVCVLPFASSIPQAARVFLEIATIRLEATGEFDVVEAAEFREAMHAEKLHSVAAMTSSELAVLSRRLGTSIFLRGNIHVFRDGSGGRSEIQFDMNMADVATGEVLWAVTHQRRGAEYAGVFQRGVIENAVSLADRAFSEAVAAQHRARLRTPRSNTRNARAER
jgi:hypothetical protein